MSGINSIEVRQKLLAITPFPSLKTVVEICRSQESAVKDSATLSNKIQIDRIKNKHKSWKTSNSSEQVKEKCHRCGYNIHPVEKCPAYKSECNYCKKCGHWAAMCRKKLKDKK